MFSRLVGRWPGGSVFLAFSPACMRWRRQLGANLALPLSTAEEKTKKDAASDGGRRRGFVNPHNSALLPWPLMLRSCRDVIATGEEGGGGDGEDEEAEEAEEGAPPSKKGGSSKRPSASSSKAGASRAKKARKAAASEGGADLSPLEKRQVCTFGVLLSCCRWWWWCLVLLVLLPLLSVCLLLLCC